jgi:hypothetical protein
MIYNKPNTIYFKTAQVLLKDADDILHTAIASMKTIKIHARTGFLDVPEDIFRHCYIRVEQPHPAMASPPSSPAVSASSIMSSQKKKSHYHRCLSELFAGEKKRKNKKFNHGNLVWAKLPGFPWYPSEIIDPPPEEMLATKPVQYVIARKENSYQYPVKFFDRPEGKRTWAWLTVDHLIPLHQHSENDELLLRFSKQSRQRKSVHQAYLRAIKQHTSSESGA